MPYTRNRHRTQRSDLRPAGVEPLVGIEPTTCSLRMSCSTIEPQWQTKRSRIKQRACGYGYACCASLASADFLRAALFL